MSRFSTEYSGGWSVVSLFWSCLCSWIPGTFHLLEAICYTWELWAETTPSTTCFVAKEHQLCCLSTPTLHPLLSRSVFPDDRSLEFSQNEIIHEVLVLLSPRSWIPVLCVSQVNWTQFLDRNISGGLEVEPKSSILYSTAIVFSKVRKLQHQLLLLLPSLSQFWRLCLSFAVWRCWCSVWGTFCLCCSCWSMTTWTTRPSRPRPFFHPMTCRSWAGLVSTCRVLRLCSVEAKEPLVDRCACRSVCWR